MKRILLVAVLLFVLAHYLRHYSEGPRVELERLIQKLQDRGKDTIRPR